jgi:hypothetical protein
MADAYGDYCRSTWLLDPGLHNLIGRNFLVRTGSPLYRAKRFSENFLWYAPEQVMTVPANSPVKWTSCTPATHGSGYGGNPACSAPNVIIPPHTISYDFGDRAVALHVYTYGGNFIAVVCGNYRSPQILSNGMVRYPVPVITGNVFSDVNKDGVHDNGESGIAGWSVKLTRVSSLYSDQPPGPAATTITDPNGNYSFPLDGIGPGTYMVSEGSGQYWHPTNGNTRTVVVGAGIGDATLNVTPFGNWLNLAPIAVIQPVPPTDQISTAGASFVLNGTASHDPDGDALTYTWAGPFGTATGPRPAVTMPAGTSDITLTVSDGERSSSTTSQVTVYPPITATAESLSGIEGHAIVGIDATFTDHDGQATVGEYTATIDWGDGTPPTTGASITPNPGGSFSVRSPHAYADEGNYQATVTITDTDNAFNAATVTTPVTVTDAELSATGTTTATTNPLTSHPVATFTDANPNATTADLTASIDWGDGITSAATVVGPAGGPFTVAGTHNYTSLGFHTITVHIADDGGARATAISHVLLYASPAGGNFVIGDGSAGNLAPGQITNGADVTFWGAQWNKLNTLTGGPAPSAFKGYDGTSGTPSPGGTWTTGPGNSARPPASIPTYMAVIVSSDITKAGSAITGDVVHIVIVHTEPGYASDPGHPGTGTVVWDLN